jgi:hypothetical protein
MSHIGKSVFHVWNIRDIHFGKVVDEKMENDWKYLHVEWVDSEGYEKSKKEVTNPKEKSNYPNWHRIDSVKVFEPTEMMASLRKL